MTDTVEALPIFSESCAGGYTAKKNLHFPVPSRSVTNQTLPGRGPGIIKFFTSGRVWIVTSRLGTGKTLTIFLQCRAFPKAEINARLVWGIVTYGDSKLSMNITKITEDSRCLGPAD